MCVCCMHIELQSTSKVCFLLSCCLKKVLKAIALKISPLVHSLDPSFLGFCSKNSLEG